MENAASLESSAPAAARRSWDLGIWGYAFGYFAAYIPYSAITTAVSSGWLKGMKGPLSGVALLPLSVLASVIGMFVFLTAMGWWKYATPHAFMGRTVPFPTRYTFVSGLLTAAIVVTTTLAYTFKGVSIVFIMLLMRGGVLIIAPIVDAVSGRKTRWFSWVGLAFSLGALVVAFSEEGGYDITFLCGVDVAVYLASYFVRLRFMSRMAKSDTGDANLRYFVEEQMIATPSVFLLLTLLALVGPGIFPEGTGMLELSAGLRVGFVDVWSGPVWPWIIVIGVCSQFTGIFGGLILLDKRENTYCVPVNRSSSILAGVLASTSLALIFDAPWPSPHKLVGAAMIIGAILFLTIPPMMEKRARARAAVS